MDINEYQTWIANFYKDRGWYDYNVFVRLNFLMEEAGELSQAVRTHEIGRDHPGERVKSKEETLVDVRDEIGDVLDAITILADKYGIGMDQVMEAHKEKFKKRFALGDEE